MEQKITRLFKIVVYTNNLKNNTFLNVLDAFIINIVIFFFISKELK